MNVFSILSGIVMVISIFISYYFYLQSKISSAVIDAINNAEDSDKVAEEKLELAIEEVNKIIPSAVKFLFTDAFISNIIQKAFSKIEEYVEKQQ